MRKKIYSLTTLLFLVIISKAHVSYTLKDSLIFEDYKKTIQGNASLPVQDLIVKTALFFQGTPYVASTLDKQPQKEILIINLRELDCTTFVENCIALSLTIKSTDASFSNFCDVLKRIRYRDGKITDYSSRLHYASDWIFENEKNGILKNISKNIGGKTVIKSINYMSLHPDFYPQLKNNKKMTDKIKKIEDSLNKREGYYVIDKYETKNTEKDIKDGDIILFSTQVSGLDFFHMGIAYMDRGNMSFIHASSVAKKVTIEKYTLFQYCMNAKKCNGISVLRLNYMP